MLTVKIKLFGIVQGVGFRPFTAVTARACGVCGTVANKGSYVEIIAQGEPTRIAAFQSELREHPPERAVILDMISEDISSDDTGAFTDFSIIESEKETGSIFVSPDIATCDACRRELFDPQNRRYLHPFINCTQCGPRLTILDTMPYDRERTSMAEFPMCEDCAAEYHDPATRRYDAQPVCCNHCGPEVYVIGTGLKGADAITAVRRAVMDGKIAAVKGIGGFHLCCDAQNTAAVERLRQLKHRPMKPFAVMMRDMVTVERECILAEGQREYLTGWQKPIMLLQKRRDTTLSACIAPDNRTVGVMLPYAPVQMLLFDYPDGIGMTDCLVMTSGNARGAPICRTDEDAVQEIGGFCDLILSHNRNIRLRADDSVCDWLLGKPYMIRRSRGFAPLPVMLRESAEKPVLAIGGELKNSFCIAKNDLLYASPYIGDTTDIRTISALRESVERMCTLLETEPAVIVCDQHPLYHSAETAREIAEKRGIPVVQIQHHYAHILSCMAENARTEPVIGVSFDGTGYGDDGSIWGGELLLCDIHGYERAGYVRPFMQTGGDLSAKEGWRIAAALLEDAYGAERAEQLCETLSLCDAKTFRIQSKMRQMQVNTVRSTSCGRIFDAVSAILGIRSASTFEGEASTALMYAAETYEASHRDIQPAFQPAVLRENGALILDTTALVREITDAYTAKHADANALAYQFHLALSEMITTACIKLRDTTGRQICALSGGVFQNRLLTRLTCEKLTAAGFEVLLHSLIPPNDGGICIGQAAYGVWNADQLMNR